MAVVLHDIKQLEAHLLTKQRKLLSRIIIWNTTATYDITTKNYEKTTAILRLYYGSADYRTLQVTTVLFRPTVHGL